MKKSKKTVSCAIAAAISLSAFAGLPGMPKLGPLGPDVVSAATGGTTPAPKPAPAQKPTTTKKPTTSTKTTTTPKAQTTTETAAKVDRILKLGSKGSDVKTLQTLLNNVGYNLKVDGIFGKSTLAAVKSFQKENGLWADGKVGSKTLALLAPPTTAPVATVPVVTPPPTAPVVTAPVVTPPATPDVVTTASIVNSAAAFEKAISKDGKWIIATLNDIAFTKPLVLEGEFKNGKKNADGTDAIQRKIALYTQDDKHVVTARFTLTAPKLTVTSPNASIQHGTFKGDLYVAVSNFKLVDAKVEGNVYFTTEEARNTFTMDAASSVTGYKGFTVDGVTTASVVDNAADFEKAISKDGKWIPCVLRDLTFTKTLVLDGDFKNGKKNADGTDAIQRKIALYTQDDKHVVTNRFVLTAPKIAIKSAKAMIQGGTFVGDVYVTVPDFQLIDATVKGNVYVNSTGFKLTKNAKVEGNVFFSNEEAKKTFIVDAGSSVTGVQEMQLVDVVTTASVVDNAADFDKAIGTQGQWIICTTKDVTTDKELVLNGTFRNGKKDAVSGTEDIQRKIGLYTQDENKKVTARFTLTAPKLTINSQNARIQSGTFKGDVYVSALYFQLVDAKVDGNVYFTSQAAMDTFKMDANSSVTGKKEVKK